MRKIERADAVVQCRDLAQLCVTHPVDRRVVTRMLDLVAASAIRGRDAVHAACALLVGFDHVVSTDAAYDVVPGLRRITPADALAAIGPDLRKPD